MILTADAELYYDCDLHIAAGKHFTCQPNFGHIRIMGFYIYVPHGASNSRRIWWTAVPETFPPKVQPCLPPSTPPFMTSAASVVRPVLPSVVISWGSHAEVCPGTWMMRVGSLTRHIDGL